MSNKRYPHLMFSEKIVSLHSKARSFDIMQNKAEYRTSLVSKSLPIAKRLSAIYSFPIAKTIRCVSPHDLYRQRPKVTNARGGQSWHNFGLAWDFGIFQDRNYLPNHPLYTTLGKLYAKIDGLEWGGTWKSFTDPPHLQLHQFGSISEARRSFET